ncbi:unnamed protein product, partial [Didymodactylos carnosus]
MVMICLISVILGTAALLVTVYCIMRLAKLCRRSGRPAIHSQLIPQDEIGDDDLLM